MEFRNTAKNEKGYLFYLDTGRLVHREVCRIVHGNYNFSWHVHHIDGNKENNLPDNLIAIPEKIHDLIHSSFSVNNLPSRREIFKMFHGWRKKQRHGKESLLILKKKSLRPRLKST